jgi:kumamolisin
MNGITSRAASAAVAAAFALALALVAPASAAVRATFVGAVPMSAEKYFTVNLKDGSTPIDTALVARYFERFGLDVQEADGANILFVHGTYGQAAAAAHTGFAYFAAKVGRFKSLTRPESYPPQIASHILATTMNDGPSAMSAAIARPAGSVAPSAGYTPSEVAQYYDIAPIYSAGDKGAGVNVAIVACNTVVPADISTFESDYSLPANAVSIKLVDGGTTANGLEPTGDVERVIGTAPLAKVTLYVVPSDCTFGDLADGMAAVVADIPTKNYIAMTHSYGATEDLYDYYDADSDLTAEDADFAAMLKKNTTPFAVSGDWGAYEPFGQQIYVGEVDPWFPASDPNVVAVGGTTAASVSSTDPKRLYELAWGVSGGGVSEKFAIPTWQKGVPGIASTTMRNEPDVALDADGNTGYAAIWTNGGVQGEYYFGGTSFAGPTWAGLLALVDSHRKAVGKKPLAEFASKLYSNRTTTGFFYDLTAGTNGYYLVKPGYDNVTGLGAVDADVMYNKFVAAP